MDKNTFDSIVDSEEFTNLINEAAPLKVRIRTDLSDKMKENCRDFLDEMAKSSPNISGIMSKKKKNRTDEEDEVLKSWSKGQKKKFKAVTKMLAPKSGTDPLKSIVEKLVGITQMARYIGNTELETRLGNLGITLDVKDLEEENPYFKDEEVREVLKDIFSQSKETQDSINSANDEIKGRIYDELDDSVKFSKDNPSGIKSSQFSNLVNTKAKSMLVSDEEYTKYKEKLLQKETADIESRTLVMEKNKSL